MSGTRARLTRSSRLWRAIGCAVAILGMPLAAAPAQAASTTSVTSVTVSLNTARGGASSTWQVGFTTSASGALAAGQAIDLAGPSGTVFPTSASSYTVNGAAALGLPQPGGANTVAIVIPAAIGASQAVQVTVSGVTNPPQGYLGPGDFSVWTAADGTAAHPQAFQDNGFTDGLSVPSGTDALALDPAHNRIFAVSAGGVVSVVALATGAVTATIDTGAGVVPGSHSIAYDATTGALYVLHFVKSTMSVVYVSTGIVLTIPVAANPTAVAVDPSTNTAYVASGGTLDVFNASTGAVTAVTISAGTHDVAVDAATDTVYVAAGDELTAVNGATDSVGSPLPLGSGSGGTPSLAVDASTDTTYVANSATGSVTAVSGATGSVLNTVAVGPDAGSTTEALAVDPTTGTVYVSYGTSGVGLATINGATGTVLHTYDFGCSHGMQVDPTTHVLYCPNGSAVVPMLPPGLINPPSTPLNAAVTSVDATQVALTWSPPAFDDGSAVSYLLSMAHNAALNPPISTVAVQSTSYTISGLTPGSVLSVALQAVNAAGAGPSTGPLGYGGSQVSITVAPPSSIGVGGTPGGVAVDSSTHMVYVSNSANGGYVSVINGVTDQVTATIQLTGAVPPSSGQYPNMDVAMDPVTHTLYVVNPGANAVDVVNTTNDQVGTPIDLPAPSWIAVDTATDRVYVSSAGGVAVIDGSTNTVTATIPAQEFADAAAGIGIDEVTDTIYVVDSVFDCEDCTPGQGDDSGTHYAADAVFDGSQMTVIDGSTNTVTSIVPLGQPWYRLSEFSDPVVDHALGMVWVWGLNGEDGLRESNNAVYGVCIVDTCGGYTPNISSATLDPVRENMYAVGCNNFYTVYTQDIQTWSLTGLGCYPAGVAVDSGLNVVYIARGGSGAVSASIGGPNTSQPPVATSTVVASEPSAAGVGQQGTVSATVSATFGGLFTGAVPSVTSLNTPVTLGAVVFSVDGTQVGDAPLGSGGTATLTLPSLPAGTHTVTAAYQGQGVYAPSTSAPVQVTVGPPASGSLASISPTSGASGTQLTLTGNGFGTVAGSVYFSQGATEVVQSVYSSWSDGSVVTTVPFGAPLGTVSVAVYSASTGDLSNAVPFTVTAVPHTIGVVASPARVAVGGTATVSGAVYDAAGQGVADAVVDLATSGGSLPATVTTSVYGGFSATFSAPATPQEVTVTASVYGTSPPLAASTGIQVGQVVTGSQSASGTNPSASEAGVTASGVGAGTLTVEQYAGDPGGTPSFDASGSYFDVAVAAGGSLSSVNVTDCSLNGGDVLEWWSGSAWVAVSPQSYDAATGCASTTLDATSTPSLAELTGTPFGVAIVDEPPSITSGAASTFTVGSAGSFAVTASGFPAASISESGSLPAGVSFTGGTLAGTPAAGTGGVYAISFTASNGVGAAASQSFTLTVDQAPAIATAATASTFTVGQAGSFGVAASGYPAGSDLVLSESGALPAGVTFTDNGDGTAALAGTPAAGTGGVYAITLGAANGVAPAASEAFTLTVDQAPAITSEAAASFTIGQAGSFGVAASGYPAGSQLVLSESGALPAGVSFEDNGGGSATLAGTPALGSAGSYDLSLQASNGVGTAATQSFTLTVQPAPTATTVSASVYAPVVGQPVVYTAEVSPAPDGGSVAFSDNGQGIAGCGQVALSGGEASCTVSYPEPGSHQIVATYTGDASYVGSHGGLSEVVGQAASSVVLTSTVPAGPGCDDPNRGPGDPGDHAPACRPDRPGPHPAAPGRDHCGPTGCACGFGGQPGLLPAAGRTVAGSVYVPSGPDISVYCQPVTLTATVGVVAPGAATPAGSVTFSDGGVSLGTAPVSTANGVSRASLTVGDLPAGVQDLTASYSGDAEVAGSSGSLSQHVEYVFVGLMPPLGRNRKVDRQAMVPVSFTLLDAQGQVVRDATATLTVDGKPAVPARRGDTGDAFRLQGDQYVYMLDLGAQGVTGPTATLTINLSDGTAQTFTLTLRTPPNRGRGPGDQGPGGRGPGGPAEGQPGSGQGGPGGRGFGR